MSALALSLGVLLAITPAELETAGHTQVLREFERIGRTAPTPDPRLTAAARRLAAEALRTGAREAADVLTISAAVSDAGGADPSPRALVIRATPPRDALETFIKRTDLNEEPASHVGVGATVEGDQAVIVALLAQRKAELRPFPHALPGPGQRTLCGELLPPLSRADLYVTRPDGQVARVRPSREEGGSFCAGISFPTEGRHTVEVIGHGPRGPEVAALFFVDTGVTHPDSARFRPLEPTDVEGARSAVLARINALRRAQGLSPLEEDPRLIGVAQAYSDQMARENFFAHVAPDGSDVRGRLSRAGYRYDRAGENLGLAPGPLAAHFALEHSPGHRKNLIDPEFTRVGVGVTFQRQGDRPQVLVTEIFAHPRLASSDSLGDAYRALASKRAALHLPPLQRSEVLEEIAFSHARRALQLDQPRSQLPGSRIHDRVFEAMMDVKSASVDFIVSDATTTFPDSKGLADPRNDRVGIGAVKGDSPTYGKDKFWMVVIYTASR